MVMKWITSGVGGAVVCALLAGCGGGGGSTGGGGGQSTITGVTVAVTPTAITLSQTATATATVSGTGSFSSAVTWSVNPSSAGTITSAGVFTPAAAGPASLIATSTQDSTKSGNASITAISIVITGPTSATIGGQAQFTAAVNGTTNTNVNWTVAGPSGWTGGVGTIDIPSSTSIVYQTPYPAPASVTLTADSAAYSTLSESTTVTLNGPAAATGPALTVDVGNELHPISPLIYGMNAYLLDTGTSSSAQIAGIAIARWGGDDTSRYNYQNGNSNSAGDYYFANGAGSGGMPPNPTGSSTFTQYVTAIGQQGATILGTMNVMGYVANTSTTACGFPQSSFPNQVSYVNIGTNSCGDGYYTVGTGTCSTSSGSYDSSVNGCSFSGGATTWKNTSLQEPPPSPPGAGANTNAWATGTWQGGWVSSILKAYGQANPPGATTPSKSVSIWDMDNEPAWWDAVHRDVHPNPSTYDEVTNGGIGTAVAIKTVDPTAQVSGPIIDYWWNYFYSKQDIEQGWAGQGSVHCYQPWDNPTDRQTHGGVAMIPYYLEQMKGASTTYNMRLLDYLDIHGYFAGSYQGNSVAFTTAGDTGEQAVREDSVRALWDPTYTNSNYPQPNYTTDPNYTSSCSVPLQAPQVVPMLHAWVNGTAPLGDPSNNYPGTKTAIDEYNWGGLESINGAVVQADVLGVFGQYGLDLATLWPTTNYNQQGPGNYAFAMYRNYDLKNDGAAFGDKALASCSTTAALSVACTPIDGNFQTVANMETGQGDLSVYGALRTADNTVTVMVINKTWGPVNSTVSLLNLATPGTVTAYQYSNSNLTGIATVPASSFTVTPAVSPSTTSTISYPFPAQSITLFVIPQ
jgi:Glycoside hydrolase family 44